MNVNERARRALEKAFAWSAARNYEGWDPYDALNSPFADSFSLGTKYGRIALTQLLRRSSVNLRRALLIKPGLNPKALGLFLEAFTKTKRFQEGREIVAKLAELRSEASGSAWGYNFPWQNRFQLLPARTPTAVNTSFIGNALLDYYEATNDQRAIDLATSIPNFFLNDLRRKNFKDGSFCFSYTPLDDNYVHNANLLAAALLTRLALDYGVDGALAPALEAARYSLLRQNDDGSWFYAERKEQRWIDSFHTGFNLEAIRRISERVRDKEYADALAKGTRFYAENFVQSDGVPKYYSDKSYLVDIHAPTELIYYFSGEGDAYAELVQNVLLWTLDNMFDENEGVFYFRKKGNRVIKTPYMRWSQAWGVRALAEFLYRV